MRELNKKIILLTGFIYILSNFARADETKYFVLIGDTGAGKSSIYEKIMGKTGLSSNSSNFVTTESRVGLTDNIMIADTPGLKASRDKLDHALQILGALKFRSLNGLIFVVSITDRTSLIIRKIEKLITPFEAYKNLISVIITKHDKEPQYNKDELENDIKNELEISNVYISSNLSTKKDYLKFFKKINAQTSDITIQPIELTRYFKLGEKDKKKVRILDKFIANYREICTNGTQYVLGLKDEQERMDATFSLNALLTDTIPEIQQEFAQEAGLNLWDNNDLMWSMHLGCAMKKELLEIRHAIDTYQKNTPQSLQTYKKCPYCGNVFVLVEMCDGITTCGNKPHAGDERPKISIFKWNWKKLLENGLRFDAYEREEREIAKLETKASAGSNPELTKPCGRSITFREMAPVTALPPEWKNFSDVEDVLDADAKDLNRFGNELDEKFKKISVIED